MREDDRDRAREILLEAFTAGWQAGLARKIRDPRAMAVVEGCFDLWLAEAIDETEVLGFVFRGREDLPPPANPEPFTAAATRWPVDGTTTPRIPPQRSGPTRRGRRASRAGRRS